MNRIKELLFGRARLLRVEELPGIDGPVLVEWRDGRGPEWMRYLWEHPLRPWFAMTGNPGKIMLGIEDYGVKWRAWSGWADEDARQRAPWK